MSYKHTSFFKKLGYYKICTLRAIVVFRVQSPGEGKNTQAYFVLVGDEEKSLITLASCGYVIIISASLPFQVNKLECLSLLGTPGERLKTCQGQTL